MARNPNIKEFIEKPSPNKNASSFLIAGGIYLFTRKIFTYLPKGKKVSLEHDVFPKIVKNHKVSGYILEGRWYDISTPTVYSRVLEEWI
jgi:NDP-sugar pyrophosphorylase family protein